MGSKTMPRSLGFPLVFTSYKLLVIERPGHVAGRRWSWAVRALGWRVEVQTQNLRAALSHALWRRVGQDTVRLRRGAPSVVGRMPAGSDPVAAYRDGDEIIEAERHHGGPARRRSPQDHHTILTPLKAKRATTSFTLVGTSTVGTSTDFTLSVLIRRV